MTSLIQVAIGPKLPEFGSWNWLGEGLSQNLHLPFAVEQFADVVHPPEADIVIFIKFLPPPQQLALVARNAKVVYLPVDIYGSCREIDDACASIRCLSKVLVNRQRLLRYFRGYCEVDYIDHPLKFALPEPRLTTDDGPIIWIGQLCNIRPVVDWSNSEWGNTKSLGREIWVLTNHDERNASANSLGFASGDIRVERWSEQKHIEYLEVATAAIDIKGNDFRARHKPPAKALDFLASGIPVITNRGSSVDFHVSQVGPSPLYVDNWRNSLTQEYRKAVFNASRNLKENLDPTAKWEGFRRNLLPLSTLTETVKH